MGHPGRVTPVRSDEHILLYFEHFHSSGGMDGRPDGHEERSAATVATTQVVRQTQRTPRTIAFALGAPMDRVSFAMDLF